MNSMLLHFCLYKAFTQFLTADIEGAQFFIKQVTLGYENEFFHFRTCCTFRAL